MSDCVGADKDSMMNTQGINSGAHSATLKGKINALEVQTLTIIYITLGNYLRHE